MSHGPHILVVEARFYPDIADALKEGALEVLRTADATYDVLEVPGAFEIPAVIAMAAGAASSVPGKSRYDGYLALGCVIRGETSHYDYVCGESARKLQDLASDRGLAIGYGILTCENGEQAMARASRDRKNKGGDVAEACLRMVEIKALFEDKAS